MRTAFWLLIAASVLGGLGQAQANDVRLLTGFEDEADLLQWEWHGASAVRTEQNATQGRFSLQLTLSPGQYPGLSLPRGSRLLTGWDEYDVARFDVFNPQSRPVGLTVRVDDWHSVNFASRYNEGFMMRPGRNTIELPVHGLHTSDRSRNLDPSQLSQLLIFASDLPSLTVLFLDNFRLEKTSVIATTAAVRAFDFGPKGSPVMEGFVGVSAADRYNKARGYGWLPTDRLWEFDDELPDSLCRDFISGDPTANFVTEFAVDVHNGTQQVVVCGQSLLNGAVHVPARTYRVLANGVEKVRVAVDAINFFTDRFLFRGIDHDWWPGKDVWKEEILPRYPEYTFPIVVTNGQLRLQFDTMAVYWLAIGVSDSWLAGIHSERQREFYSSYFYLEPYKIPVAAEKISLNAARGQTVSAFFTCPKSGAPGLAPSFPGCTAEVRAIRLTERPIARGIYRIEESTLGPLSNHPHAQRFALTVNVGKQAVPGVYHGEVAGIPVELNIWAFELPSSDQLDMTYGWYYNEPRDLNYYFGHFPGKAAEIRTMRDREFRDMVEHGFNSVTAIRPVVRADGSLDNAQADEFLAAAGRAGLVGRHPVPVETLGIARRLSHVMGAAEFSKPFLPVYQRSLAAFRDWTHRKSFPILAYVVDEPREQALNPWNRDFEDTKRYLDLHRAAGLRTMVTLAGDSSFGKSYLPLLGWVDVVSTHPTENSRRTLEATRSGKPQLWLYNAGMNRFTFGFLPWADGATGRWEWHYEWWTQAYSPFARVDENAWSTGCGAVLPSPDGPVTTVAYEEVRAGIDDYRYLFLLEKLIQEHSGKTAEEARHLLEGVRSKIPRYTDKEGVDEATLDDWREKIAQSIVALEGEAGRNRDTASDHSSGRPRQP
ncbi:MAG: hypothetical protein ABSG14_01040 [Verrucomicrobiia bacterium]|jgi:hypothetical protein